MAIAQLPWEAREVDETPSPPSLEEIHASLDVPGCRVELLQGRIVVSPSPIKRHNRIVTWLADSLQDVCEEHDWDRLPEETLELATTRERIEPDLLICPVDEATDDDWMVPASSALLVVEVVSSSSRHDDYETKRRACALSDVPLYLVIDTEAAALTLFAKPSERGYLEGVPLPIGGKLTLPDPFDLTLDTSTMPR